MPELPEIEATVRLLDGALRGATVDSARSPGLATMQTFSPSLDALAGATCVGLGRRGKLLQVRFAGGGLGDGEEATLMLHLMSAGRLQLWNDRASTKDRRTRLVVRLNGGADGHDGERELRLREFGTKQAAWARLLRPDDLAADETLLTLGPEAWPDPPDLEILPPRRTLRGALRDQRVIAGIGRSWADEILWAAKIAPLRRCGDLDEQERTRLRQAIIDVLGGALDLYLEGGEGPNGKPRAPLALPLPDKMPLPLRVHRHVGEPCPRCGTPILAVHYEDDEMAYCPVCQTGGKPYKDRRMSRLLID
jgi:formamidopyrimidine-DNA glycosylase